MQPENRKPTPTPNAKPSIPMPMFPGVECFARLRTALVECLIAAGAPGDVSKHCRGVTADIGELGSWQIPFFPAPQVDDLERVILDVLAAANEPLQQKEIAKKGKISIRLVQRKTPTLQDRGLIVRHPSQGFHLPGRGVAGSIEGN